MTTIRTGRGTIQTTQPYRRRWRGAHYRLMALSRGGRIRREMSGSLAYLFHIAAQRKHHYPTRAVVGRSWIELNVEPATRVP